MNMQVQESDVYVCNSLELCSSVSESDFGQKIWKTLEDMGLTGKIPLGQDALISGSLLWKVLTNGKWRPHDVDIFCTRLAVPRLRQFFVDNGYLLMWAQKHYYTEFSSVVEEWAIPGSKLYKDQGCAEDYHNSVNSEWGLPNLPTGVKFGVRRKNHRDSGQYDDIVSVQLVIADAETAKDASFQIRNKFDFPTLENWFDGQELFISYPEMVQKRMTTFRDQPYGELPKSVWETRRVNRVLKYETEFGLKVDAPEWLREKVDNMPVSETAFSGFLETLRVSEKELKRKVTLQETKLLEQETKLLEHETRLTSQEKYISKLEERVKILELNKA